MGNAIEVDVVIPNYNRIGDLERALTSIRNQEYIARIIIVDDGSNIETQNYYSNLTSTHPKVEVLIYPHTGDPGYLRKVGVAHSTSQWIAFLDSDDEWLEGKIQTQLEFALRHKLVCVCSNAWNIKAKPPKKRYFDSSRNQFLTFKGLLSSNKIVTSTLIAKRELLESIDYFAHGIEVMNSEDYATWLRILTKCNIGFLDIPLINYYSSETSFSRNVTDDVNSKAISDFTKWLSSNKKKNLFKKCQIRAVILNYILQAHVTSWLRNTKIIKVFKK
jgi:glycosyltransferase involved in cell wall biosynthesis